MRSLKKIYWLVISLVTFVPVITLAVTPSTGYQNPQNPGNLPELGGGNYDATSIVFSVISRILLPVAGTIAVLFIIIGGYQYLFSGASEELAAKGKKTLVNAIIGLVIILLSYVMVRVIGSTLIGI